MSTFSDSFGPTAYASQMLRVCDLGVSFFSSNAEMPVVNGASFAVAPTRITALVGESGCGKSITALAILRLLPTGSRITGGQITFDGHDLLTMSDANLRRICGRRIGMVFQEPMSALD